MMIDSHQHFWRYDAQRDTWITDEMSFLRRDFLPEDLIPELKANSVDGCIAVQADQSERETKFLLELARDHGEIKGVVGWIDLCSPQIWERLRYFSQFPKLRGFRHIAQAEPDDRFLMRADFLRGIGALSEFEFTYDILIYPKQLPAATEMVSRFPGLRFALDHMAKPPIRSAVLEPWAALISPLARAPNVYCKLSGLVTEADWRSWKAEDVRPYLDIVMELFGPDRVMFGSDWPVCLLAGSYAEVKNLLFVYANTLPREKQERIFGLNAIEFYKLESKHYGSGATG
ncbi:MAG: amidohydrolase family protein [Acidobacteria bacterium]|nr:amidohydrolase family protein [Acidobacteriota bacterium]